MARFISDTEYTFDFSDSKQKIYAGKNGVTVDFIRILQEEDKKEELNNRYEREHRDYLIECLKETNEEEGNEDPIERVGDLRYSPETILFSKPVDRPLRERIETILPELTEDQRRLYRCLCQGMGDKDCAPIFNTTPDAINKRKIKLRARIRKLLKISER